MFKIYALFRSVVHKNLVKQLKFCYSARKPFTMKIESPQFKAILTEEVKILEKIFVDNDFEIRIAGGAVRDLLLGIQPKDLDFATVATPSQMKNMFESNNIRMINEAGEKHGTITPRINDKENFEVTTLRIDVVTDGRRAVVEFVKDWHLDANRRDLTINSMFLGLDGTVYDYFKGYEDLMNRRIVFVGDAATRIREDYLRILRYFRFFGRIADDSKRHDTNTLEALKNNCSGLERVSGERIWTELHKTLEGNFRFELLELIVKLGISKFIGLPDDCNLNELHQLSLRIQDDLLKCVRPIAIICGLLNNVDELITFRERCKINNTDRDCALFIIEHRADERNENMLKRYKIIIQSSNKPNETRIYVEQLLIYKGYTELYDELKKWTVPRFPVSGKMLCETTDVEPGPMLGIILHKLKGIWHEKDCQPTVDELLKEVPTVLEQLQKNKKPRTK